MFYESIIEQKRDLRVPVTGAEADLTIQRFLKTMALFVIYEWLRFEYDEGVVDCISVY